MLVVPDTAPIRHDVKSRDMDRVHPEVKHIKTPEERQEHLRRCDTAAYRVIECDFPNFTPPGAKRDTTNTSKRTR